MMQLIHELAVFEKAPNEVVANAETLLQSGFQEHPLFVAWVAEKDGLIVGGKIFRTTRQHGALRIKCQACYRTIVACKRLDKFEHAIAIQRIQ
jgi:hypothetical protein